MIINPKDDIKSIIEPLNNPKAKLDGADIIARIERVSEILQAKPELKSDNEVYTSLLSATENNVYAVEFRNSLINDHCLSTSNKTGTLKLTKDELYQLTPDEFWTYIEKQSINKLVISTDDGEVTYTSHMLQGLIFIKPTFDDLTEKCTLNFSDDRELAETRAKLRLCGDLFKLLFEAVPGEKGPVDMLDTVSFENFNSVLAAVNAGKFKVDNLDAQGELAIKYLEFPPEDVLILPESVIGKELLEKYLGNIGEVPRPTLELLEALEAPCPFSNDPTIKTKDSHVVMWVPRRCEKGPLTLNNVESLINSERLGDNKIGFDRNRCYFPKGVADQEVEGGYWLLMSKKPLEATRRMTYDDAAHYIKDHFPNYEVPLTIDATLCALLTHVCSGEKKELILNRENPLCYTWCQENGQTQWGGTWHIVVGALARSGLSVSVDPDAYDSIGVCPARKFLGTRS